MNHGYLPNQPRIQKYILSPEKVTKLLLIAIIFLVVGNIIEREIVQWLNTISDTEISSNYFNFDGEFNFPSFYSALTLGFCSYLLMMISTFRKTRQSKYIKHWKALSLIFVYLAIDEAFSIHELSIIIIRDAINARGFFYFAWVIPGFFLLMIFLLIYRKFIIDLPAKTQKLFVLAGCIYISGALGMELIGGYIADTFGFDTFAYKIAFRIEELLEMFGILIFIHGLLFHIQSQFAEPRFSISLRSKRYRS